MGLSPIATATIQSAVLAATSNLLAQTVMSYQNEVCCVPPLRVSRWTDPRDADVSI